MSRSDAAWVDVLPRMKDFAGPLIQGVKDAARQAGTEGGKAISDSMTDAAKKTDLSPIIEQLQKAEKAAKDTAAEQSASARKAADELTRAKERIVSARSQEATAAAQVVKAENDLEKRRGNAAQQSDAIQKAEAALAAKREDQSASAEDLAKAEATLVEQRRKSSNAEADLTTSAAKLEAARSKQAAASTKYSNEETALKAAVKESQTAQAQAADAAEHHARVQGELGTEVDKAAQEAQKSVPLWKRLWDGVGDTSGIADRVKGTLASVREEITKEGARIQSRGQSLLSGLGKGLKWGAAAGGAAIAGGLGASLFGGFNRLADIEDARASLLGLGKDAKTVDRIMDDALKSVKGTAYGLGDAAKLSGTLVASGIQPGQDLQKTLGLVADSATIAKRDLGDMGLIWSSVASKGKLQGDDAMQLLESGIPIWQMVGKEMGITAGEAQELGSKGKVSFEVFQTAMENSLGGAAKKSGETVRGSFDNMKAAVSRFGAGILQGVFPLFAPALKKVIGVLDAGTAAAEPFFAKVTDGAKGLYDLLVKGDFTGALTTAFGWEEDSPAVDMLLTLRDTAISVGSWIQQHLLPIFITIGTWLRDNLGPILAGVAGALAYLGGSAVIGAIGSLVGVIGGAVAAIGWIPLAIGAAVGALTWFFTKTETGKAILDGLIGVLGGLWEAVKVVATGDFNGGIFGLQEDNPIIGALITIHDTIVDVGTAVQTNLVDGWNAVVKAWQTGETDGNPVLDLLVKLRDFGTGAWDGIIGAFDQIKAAVSSLGGSGGEGLSKFAGAISWIGEQLGRTLTGTWNLLKGFGSFIAQLFTGVILPLLSDVWGFIANTLGPIVLRLWTEYVGPALAAIGAAFVWVFGNIVGPALSGLGWFLSNVLGPVFSWLYEYVISPVITAIGAVVTFVFNTVVFPVLDALKWVLTVAIPAAAQFLWGVISTVWNALAGVFTWLWQSVIVPVWEGIRIAIAVAVAVVMTIIDGLVWVFQNVLAPVFSWLYANVILPVWNGIQAAIGFVVEVVKGYINGWVWLFQNILAPAFSWLYNNVILPVWNGIQTAISAVVGWFRDTAWPVISTVIGYVQTGFGIMKDKIGEAWSWVKDKIIDPVVSWFRDTIGPIFDTVTGGISKAFDTMKEGVAKAWDAVKEKATAPIKFVVETVVRDGIVKNFNKVASKFGVKEIDTDQFSVGFQTGGILPGYTPGRDVHSFYSPALGQLDLSGGEAIMRPEVTRAVGHGWVNGANAAARSGGIAGVQSFLSGDRHAHKDGGILDWFKDVGGDALDYIKGGAKFVSDVVSDPLGVFKKLADTMVEKVPGGGLIRDVGMAVPKSIASAIGNSLGGAITASDSSTAAVPSTNTGARTFPNWQAQYAGLRGIASSMGLRMTSNYRGGARTAQSGMTSLHALGRAVDWAGPAGGMSRFFDYVDANYNATELLYSPKGGRNKHRSGRRGPNTGATLKNHYSHVHAGFHRGGIVDMLDTAKPMLYDRGGWLQPGFTLVNNASGTPEPVFPGKQGASIVQMLESGRTPGKTITVPITATQLADADVDRLAVEIIRRLELQMAEED